MAMAFIWVGITAAAVICGAANGCMAAVSAAALDGARAAVELCISWRECCVCGPALWSF